MIRVVLTSFEPFGGHSANSSLEAGCAVARRPPPGIELEWLLLPVAAGSCVERAWECIGQVRPSLVLALGQAAGSACLRIERLAVNWHDFSIPDNAGNQPRRQLIEKEGPIAYRSTIPGRTLQRTLTGRKIPARLSYSAGTYVCNHLFYRLLHRAQAVGHPHQTGFLHLPLLPSQERRRSVASLSLDCLSEGIRLAITACVETGQTGSASGTASGREGSAETGMEGTEIDSAACDLRSVPVAPSDPAAEVLSASASSTAHFLAASGPYARERDG